MSCSRRLAHIIISVCFIVVFLSIHDTAYSSSFSDAFKSFVLGSKATTTTTNFTTVQFPVKSQAEACMQCHNGTHGQKIHMKHADSPVRQDGYPLRANHPVGMEYRRYAEKNFQSFIAPDELNQLIVLEDGNVTCISCHQTKTDPVAVSGEKSIQIDSQYCNVGTGYTTGTSQTQLCMSCHAM